MVAGRFLQGYRERTDLAWIMDRFSMRLGQKFDAESIISHFFDQINLYSEDFTGFFPELQESVRNYRPVSDII
jgi:hypothetical protein